MHVLDIPVICTNIKKVPNGFWLRELNNSVLRFMMLKIMY